MAHIHFLPLPLSHVLPRCRQSGWQISAHRRDPGENMAVKWEDDHKPLDVESLTLSNSSIRHGTQTYTNYIHAYDCIICKWTSNIYMHINKKNNNTFQRTTMVISTAVELISTPSNCWRWVVLVETAHAIHDQGGWKPRQCWKMGETMKKIHEHPGNIPTKKKNMPPMWFLKL